MEPEDSRNDWLARLRNSPEEQIRWMNEYAARLLRIATGLLATVRDPAYGPEDAIQSVYKSFFTRTIRNEALNIQNPDDLLALLAVMTRNKCVGKIRERMAKKRDRSRLLDVGDTESDGMDNLFAGPVDPTADAVTMIDLVGRIFQALPTPMHKEVFRLLLAGCGTEAISTEVNRFPRTVRRRVDEIRRHMFRIFELTDSRGRDDGNPTDEPPSRSTG